MAGTGIISPFITDAETSQKIQDAFERATKIKGYSNVIDMLSNQLEQNNNTLCLVSDARGDDSTFFKEGERRLQAVYRFNGISTGSLEDYTLLSAPFAKIVDGNELELGETSTTAHRGDHGKHAYDSIKEIEGAALSLYFLIHLNF